ncbi:MAG: hypothetical protein M0R70_02760 [Nitrospirae bacterium]|nr:hypothetical protein [Nitrospirota bacterium]
MDDELCQKMKAINWKWADKDPNALQVLEGRIADAGSMLGIVVYSDLVRGIDFHVPTVNNGNAYRIQTHEWSGFDRGLIGEFLGYISMRSYCEHGFMASALVVNKIEFKPSDHFFQWMETLNVLPDTTDDTVLKFWIEEVNKAHN